MFEEKFLEPHFTSVLAPYMLDVVEQKRALGNKYNAGVEALSAFDDFWCCTIKVDIENSKGQYIEKDKQEATKDGSESTKIQHGI